MPFPARPLTTAPRSRPGLARQEEIQALEAQKQAWLEALRARKEQERQALVRELGVLQRAVRSAREALDATHQGLAAAEKAVVEGERALHKCVPLHAQAPCQGRRRLSLFALRRAGGRPASACRVGVMRQPPARAFAFCSVCPWGPSLRRRALCARP
jgi:crotonobetainyl-CoA:carnitine CoA-transferase CaiB-like acyl-CoA transferase